MAGAILPMPPSPILEVTEYGPRVVPTAKGMMTGFGADYTVRPTL